MGATTDRSSARNRARHALADKQTARRARDVRMEAAATKYFAAADAVEKAHRDAGEAIRALVDEGEPRGVISELLGIRAREIKLAVASVSATAEESRSDGVVSARDEQTSEPSADEITSVA